MTEYYNREVKSPQIVFMFNRARFNVTNNCLVIIGETSTHWLYVYNYRIDFSKPLKVSKVNSFLIVTEQILENTINGLSADQKALKTCLSLYDKAKDDNVWIDKTKVGSSGNKNQRPFYTKWLATFNKYHPNAKLDSPWNNSNILKYSINWRNTHDGKNFYTLIQFAYNKQGLKFAKCTIDYQRQYLWDYSRPYHNAPFDITTNKLDSSKAMTILTDYSDLYKNQKMIDSLQELKRKLDLDFGQKKATL